MKAFICTECCCPCYFIDSDVKPTIKPTLCPVGNSFADWMEADEKVIIQMKEVLNG